MLLFQAFLGKVSQGKSFPWKSLIFVVILAIAGAVAMDVNAHNGFKSEFLVISILHLYFRSSLLLTKCNSETGKIFLPLILRMLIDFQNNYHRHHIQLIFISVSTLSR